MNVGSLFSGAGGLDLGLHRAGFRHEFFCEADPYRRRILERHWPGVPVYEDVRSVGGEHAESPGGTRLELRPGGELRCDLRAVGVPCSEPQGRRNGADDGSEHGAADWAGGVDLLCGGFPCQDLSVAGRRRGLAGERSGLFFEFARIAGELVRPGGFILLENVPGLLSSNDGRDFAVVLASLAELGFHDLAWRVLDSRYFGVPQRRRRVFVLARRACGRVCAEVLLEPEGGGGDPPQGGEAGEGVAGALVSGTLGARGKLGGNTSDIDRAGAYVVNGVAAPLTRGSASPGVSVPGRRQEDDVTSEGFDASEDGTGRGTPLTAFFSENQRAEVLETPYARQLTGGGGKPGQGYPAIREGQAVRRLTPTECERLQGLPDGWTVPYGPSLADAENAARRAGGEASAFNLRGREEGARVEMADVASLRAASGGSSRSYIAGGGANALSCPYDPPPDGPRYAACGDAVTAPVAEWLGRRLLAHAGGEAA